MEPSHDWRSPHYEEQLSRLDRGGVSFEFLRRNHSYRADYKLALEEIASDRARKDAAIGRLSRRWGLQFPSRPLCLRSHRCALVATTALSCHCHRHRRTGRLWCAPAS
ncbi:transcriptional regulator domain-containing protein [Mesorhizobium sp. L-8-3]|uniref:transcriptional regulator domain-containing protein n=1 Tax=Mesorhizobium sp. L-8-3 TaxID=2744522 RepID=UPI001FCFCDC7|nr:DUF6499 domain-containing protein [Mesorhizobium sp. L-8-3]